MKNTLFTNKTIACNTSITYQAKLHWISYVIPIIYVFLGILSLPFIITTPLSFIGIICWFFIYKSLLSLYKIIQNKRTTFYITDHYVTVSTGVFSNIIIDMPLKKLENISLFQSFFGKIFNYGTLYINAGNTSTNYKIANPVRFRQELLNYI